MRTLLTPTRLWVGLIAAILLGGLVASSRPASAVGREALNADLLATVHLIVLDAQGKQLGSCSGSIVNPAGLILTDYHCVGVTDDGEDPTESGLKPGDTFNPD